MSQDWRPPPACASCPIALHATNGLRAQLASIQGELGEIKLELAEHRRDHARDASTQADRALVAEQRMTRVESALNLRTVGGGMILVMVEAINWLIRR